MKRCIYIIAIAFVFLTMISCDFISENRNSDNLVFADEFNYTGMPDSSKWTYFTNDKTWGWGKNELQAYTFKRDTNAYVSNGVLKITARKEEFKGKKYTSARLTSHSSEGWKYVTIKIKAKADLPQGTTCKIYMLPVAWEYGPWPESGAIHIMEMKGSQPNKVSGIIQTKIYNRSLGNQRQEVYDLGVKQNDFNLYKLSWTESKLAFFVNDKKYHTYKKRIDNHEYWPFDQEFYLLLSISVGGDGVLKQDINPDDFPAILQIDYIRIHQSVTN